MTEVEWLACDDPAPLLNYLHEAGRATTRKTGLWAMSCGRRLGYLRPAALTEQLLDEEERRLDNLDGLPVWSEDLDTERRRIRQTGERRILYCNS